MFHKTQVWNKKRLQYADDSNLKSFSGFASLASGVSMGNCQLELGIFNSPARDFSIIHSIQRKRDLKLAKFIL